MCHLYFMRHLEIGLVLTKKLYFTVTMRFEVGKL